MRIERVVTASPRDASFTNNTWMVGDDGGCVVIDPAHDAGPTVAAIGRRVVSAILITHGHWDHVGATPPLREATRAPVLLGRADTGLWNETLPQEAPDGYLEDGQVIPLANGHIEVRAAPGHTPGSHVFVLWQGTGADGAPTAVFTGDTVFPGGPGATRWGYSSFDTIIDSIRDRILDLPDSTMLHPGHGESTTVGEQRGQFPEWIARGW